MKRTIIDIRQDGPHVMPDPGTTVVHQYDPRLLEKLGKTEISPEYHAGLCSGLGAFYDALVRKGHNPDTVQSLLWDAWENLNPKAASRGPVR